MLDLESLFKLNYPMCIMCAAKEGKFAGCIVNTVFQIVPEPPTVVVSLNKQSLIYEYVIESGTFTISVLTAGAPIITDHTTSFIEAQVVQAVDSGIHTLFIGKITACETMDDAKIPMSYRYYRDVKGGKTPRTAATYIKKEIKTDVESRSHKYEKVQVPDVRLYL